MDNKLPAGFWFSIAGMMKSWSEEYEVRAFTNTSYAFSGAP